jgi:hypothetical protein
MKKKRPKPDLVPLEPTRPREPEPPTYHEPVIHRVSRSRVTLVKGTIWGILGLATLVFVIHDLTHPVPPIVEPSPVPIVATASPTATDTPTVVPTTGPQPTLTPTIVATPVPHHRHACSHNGREIVVGNYHDCMEKCDSWGKCNRAFPFGKQ